MNSRKKLNMENKDLIDRIEKLGIQVKNHMSTLTDSAALKIRQQFAEVRPVSEKVEEKRIGREVIRRRKRFELQPEPEAPQAPAVEEQPAQAVVEVLEEPPAEAPVEIESVSEAPAETALHETAQPEINEVAEKAEPVARPARKHEAARIVKAAPVRQEPKAPEPVPMEELKPAAVVEPPRPVVVQPVAPPTEPVSVEPRDLAPKAAAPAKSAEISEDEEEEGRGKKRGKKRRRKKGKKEEPAKIIALPDVMGEEAEEEPDLTELAARFMARGSEIIDPALRDQKRRKPEEAGAKPGRRKEVFQKEDLYSKKQLAAQGDRGRARAGRQPSREAPKPEPVAQKSARSASRLMRPLQWQILPGRWA